MSRPDYIVYDTSEAKRFLIIHELSEGTIQNKKSKALRQFLGITKMINEAPRSREYCNTFQLRHCYVSAKGCPEASPLNMADGFMQAYNNLPEPLYLNNAVIEGRGFLVFMSNVVKLEEPQ